MCLHCVYNVCVQYLSVEDGLNVLCNSRLRYVCVLFVGFLYIGKTLLPPLFLDSHISDKWRQAGPHW